MSHKLKSSPSPPRITISLSFSETTLGKARGRKISFGSRISSQAAPSTEISGTLSLSAELRYLFEVSMPAKTKILSPREQAEAPHLAT